MTAVTKVQQVVARMGPVMVQVAAARILQEPCAKTIVAMETMNNLIRIAMAVRVFSQRLPVAETIFVRTAAVVTAVAMTAIVPVRLAAPMGPAH